MNLSFLRPGRAIGPVAVLVAAGLFWLPAAPASAGFGIALRPAHAAVYGNRQDPVKKTGAWLSTPTGTVTVAPHSEQPVTFTVKVPKDAGAGDHLAGVAFEDVHSTSAGSNFAVTQVVRAVMGVQVLVPGPGAFSVHVDSTTLQSLPGVSAASVLVTLGNNGTRLGKPGLSVALTGPKGYQRTVSRTLDTILPGDTIAFPFSWPDVLQPGDYSITATATAPGTAPGAPTAPGAAPGSPGGAPVVHTVSAHLGTALAGVPAPGVVTPAPAPAKHSSRGYPMAIVVALVAVAGIGGGLYLGRRGSHPKARVEEPAPVLATEGRSHSVDR